MDPSKLYIEMLEKSPVQKEWKHHNMKIGCRTNEGVVTGMIYRTLADFHPEYIIANAVGKHKTEDLIWVPYQEDWQEMYGRFVIDNAASLDKIDMNGGNLTVEYIDIDAAVQSTDLNDIRNFNDIRWCAFYHKEVLGLVWSFDKGEWVKA